MKTVKQIILKHYKLTKRVYKNRGWEKCGEEIYDLIRQEEEKIRGMNLIYPDQCKMFDAISRQIENEYEKYFALYVNGQKVGYDWINGNNLLKQLISDK